MGKKKRLIFGQQRLPHVQSVPPICAALTPHVQHPYSAPPSTPACNAMTNPGLPRFPARVASPPAHVAQGPARAAQPSVQEIFQLKCKTPRFNFKPPETNETQHWTNKNKNFEKSFRTQQTQTVNKLPAALGIGFGAGVGTLLVVAIVFIIYHRRNKKYNATSSWISRYTSPTSSMNDIEKEVSYYGVQTFSYNELQKATNNFDSKKEVGAGGFGTVYQVQTSRQACSCSEAIIRTQFQKSGTTHEPNRDPRPPPLPKPRLPLRLHCTSRHCHEFLLVYEYISNGPVADHLHGNHAKLNPLSWTTRMSIAFETASSLAYLHASDVIHRNVKTNKILLDNSFCIKVADFGLSRLFLTDVSHVSMAPQGTPGYVDPKYHECYQLTDKSDVYSFGVVLIELISSKQLWTLQGIATKLICLIWRLIRFKIMNFMSLLTPILGLSRIISDTRPSMREVLEVLKEISSVGYDRKVADEMDILADDVVLLKSDPPTLSANSLRQNWVSGGSTTSNASGS
ncbi:unnamed protein product [Camellia sinensis]